MARSRRRIWLASLLAVALAGGIVTGTQLSAGADGLTSEAMVSSGPFGITQGQRAKLGISNWGNPAEIVVMLAFVDDHGMTVMSGEAEVAQEGTAFIEFRLPAGVARMELRAAVGYGNPDQAQGSAVTVQVLDGRSMKTMFVVEMFHMPMSMPA